MEGAYTTDIKENIVISLLHVFMLIYFSSHSQVLCLTSNL